MKSTSETGHAKNVANFEKLITDVAALATAYNPSKANLHLKALNAQLIAAKAAITAINSSEAAYKNAITTREAAFANFSKLITFVRLRLLSPKS